MDTPDNGSAAVASETVLGAGTAEHVAGLRQAEAVAVDGVAATDAGAVAVMNGQTAMTVRTEAPEGTYIPAEAKLYPNFLKIGYGTGEGFKSGIPAGAFFFNKTTEPIVKAGTAMKFVILRARGFWREWKKFDPNIPPREFLTEALARAAGLTTQNSPYGSGGPMAQCSPAVELQILIKKPAKVDTPEFCIPLDGKLYALARTIVEKGQYREIERTLANIARCDETFRKSPAGSGLVNAYPMTFTTMAEMKPVKNKQTGVMEEKAIIHLALAFCFTDAGERIRTTDKFHSDFLEYKQAIAMAMAAPVVADEEAAM